jgi:cytochrome c oxidase subunit IV
METTTHSASVYWKTCASLMALLAVTWGIGYVNLGAFNLVVALAISISKALLVALFFMHIKGSSRLFHLAATAGVIWLLILFSLTLGDYFTRNFLQPTSNHKVPPEQFHGAPEVVP